MQSYYERSNQLAADAQVSVLVLGNPETADAEFLPLAPRTFSDAEAQALRARWPGRGLRVLGVLGLCGASPRCVFKEPLDPRVVDALASAFLTYLHVLFGESLAEQREAAEIAELERLFSLPDTRPN
jgi:hypothetical protein